MSEVTSDFQPTWAIVELMGRQRIAGMVSEQVIAGAPFLRVDVPETETKQQKAFTKWFGGSAIYAITPTDEATCKYAALHFQTRPVEQWVVPDRLLPSRLETEESSDGSFEDGWFDDESELER